MELKDGVSAKLHFIQLAILFQEVIREYMSKHNSIEFFSSSSKPYRVQKISI